MTDRRVRYSGQGESPCNLLGAIRGYGRASLAACCKQHVLI